MATSSADPTHGRSPGLRRARSARRLRRPPLRLAERRSAATIPALAEVTGSTRSAAAPDLAFPPPPHTHTLSKVSLLRKSPVTHTVTLSGAKGLNGPDSSRS